MDLINQAIDAEYVFVSVMGPHAQENENEIFSRKIDDVNKSGKSFWVSKINKNFVEECRYKLKGKTGYLLLVESSNNGKSAVDTKVSESATQYSNDKVNWKDIDWEISPVTGNLGKGATAYYFNGIELCNELIDLNLYGEECDDCGVKFTQGRTNVFAKRYKIRRKEGMKSSKRKVVAVLRLIEPYVVWVK